jgi:hypothetical protein
MEDHDTDAHKHMVKDRTAPRDLRRIGRDGLHTMAIDEMRKHDDGDDHNDMSWEPINPRDIGYKTLDVNGDIDNTKRDRLAGALETDADQELSLSGYLGIDVPLSAAYNAARRFFRGAHPDQRKRDEIAQEIAEKEHIAFSRQNDAYRDYSQFLYDYDQGGHVLTPELRRRMNYLEKRYRGVATYKDKVY